MNYVEVMTQGLVLGPPVSQCGGGPQDVSVQALVEPGPDHRVAPVSRDTGAPEVRGENIVWVWGTLGGDRHPVQRGSDGVMQ